MEKELPTLERILAQYPPKQETRVDGSRTIIANVPRNEEDTIVYVEPGSIRVMEA